MKKILIFGSNSFMAKHLIPELLSLEYKVYTSSIKPSNLHRYFQVDITKKNQFNKLPKDIDVVINFSAYIGEDWNQCMQVNVVGIINILNYCKLNGICKFIHSSSSAVYGIPQYFPVDEKHPKSPVSNYGKSKLIAEWIIENYNLKSTIFRYSSPFGFSQKANSVLPIFINKVMKGQDLTVYRGGKRKQEFIYVKDIVSAIILALKSKKGDFNIGSNNVITMKELANLIINVFSKTKKNKIINKDIKETAICIHLNSQKAQKELGFKAKYDIKTALEDYKKLIEKDGGII